MEEKSLTKDFNLLVPVYSIEQQISLQVDKVAEEIKTKLKEGQGFDGRISVMYDIPISCDDNVRKILKSKCSELLYWVWDTLKSCIYNVLQSSYLCRCFVYIQVFRRFLMDKKTKFFVVAVTLGLSFVFFGPIGLIFSGVLLMIVA